MEIWNNPSCSKCAVARELMDQAGVGYTTRSYLDQPPTAAELTAVLDRLGMQPWDITRLNEPIAAELGLAEAPRDREVWIAVLAAHPILIQRPILLTDDGRAVVGRTAEQVRSLLDD
ncbi:MAG TPA: ArsC/Spx/MgsR family protein [Mycobacteriales bacterium]|nr:ArsC/Spx/MgsR family protein [Mycobacteriales bacterium]